jgi:hypothetical protein
VQELKRKGVDPELASTAVRNFFGEQGKLEYGPRDMEYEDGEDEDGEDEGGTGEEALGAAACCLLPAACSHAAAVARSLLDLCSDLTPCDLCHNM